MTTTITPEREAEAHEAVNKWGSEDLYLTLEVAR